MRIARELHGLIKLASCSQLTWCIGTRVASRLALCSGNIYLVMCCQVPGWAAALPSSHDTGNILTRSHFSSCLGSQKPSWVALACQRVFADPVWQTASQQNKLLLSGRSRDWLCLFFLLPRPCLSNLHFSSVLSGNILIYAAGAEVLSVLTLLSLNLWKRKSLMVGLSSSGWNMVPDTRVVQMSMGQ